MVHQKDGVAFMLVLLVPTGTTKDFFETKVGHSMAAGVITERSGIDG